MITRLVGGEELGRRRERERERERASCRGALSHSSLQLRATVERLDGT